jgi:hypothetical protein
MAQVSRQSVIAFSFTVGVVLVSVLSASCHASYDTITLSLPDNGRTVVAAVGDRIEVILGVVGPFYFGSPAISSASVRLVSQSDEFPSQPNPGGGKTQRYVFEAMTVGLADVAIPRDLPAPEGQAFRITVQVY